MGFPDRAPAYRANMWEYIVTHADRNYTYYLPLTEGCSGKPITIRLLLCDSSVRAEDLRCDVWLCPRH